MVGTNRIAMVTAGHWIGVAAAVTAVLFAGSAQAQENKFALNGNVVSTYDTNILRLNDDRFSGPHDDVTVSPRLEIDYSRLLGQQHIFLNGTAGYVFNTRFTYLNREEINLNSGAGLRFGARCTSDLTGSLYRAQSDLQDLGAAISNTVNTQNYLVVAQCKRPVGFYPKISFGYATTHNSEIRRERDQDVIGGRAGLVYTRPSLGGIEAFFEYNRINRPNRQLLNGLPIEDRTEVTTFGVRYQRSVGSLFTVDLNAGRTHADPTSSRVRDFTGLTYGASFIYGRSTLGSITAGVDRTVSAQGNVGSSYYINNAVFVSITRQFTAKTSATGKVSYGSRDFRGEDNDLRFGPRGTDKSVEVSADIHHRLNRRVSMTLAGRYRDRNSQNNFYDYASTQVTLGASLGL